MLARPSCSRLPRLAVRPSAPLCRATLCRAQSGAAAATAPAPVSVLASHKICVVPFRQTPEQALYRLHMNGLIASASISNIFYAALLRLFGPSITPLAAQWDLGASLRLKDVKAAYWPVWRVDYMGEGKVHEAGGGRERLAWIGAREAYVPGNPFAPLSYLSFAVPPLPDDLATYDPATDLAQLGAEYPIVEVPFTVDALKFADKVRATIGRGREVEGVRFELDGWRDTLLAAYPLMFPVYIAEFESSAHVLGEDDRGFTVVMDAHDEVSTRCRVSFPPPPAMRESGRFENNYWVNPAPFTPMLNVLAGLPPSEHVHPGNLAPAFASAYQAWMSPPPSGSVVAPSPTLSVAETSATGAAGESGIDWADDRVQPWHSAERDANGHHIETCLGAYRTLCGLDAVEAITAIAGPEAVSVNVRVGSGGLKVEKKGIDEIRREHAETRARVRAEVEESKPAWLASYDEAQAGKAGSADKA
ncbi:hypothetical protein Q5752_006791 [Cryptotrichosporon argae]